MSGGTEQVDALAPRWPKESTHCAICDKPFASAEDYDRYEGGEGEHLCWTAWGSCAGEEAGDYLELILSLRARLAEAERQKDEAIALLRDLVSDGPIAGGESR